MPQVVDRAGELADGGFNRFLRGRLPLLLPLVERFEAADQPGLGLEAMFRERRFDRFYGVVDNTL
jgi:hypothetical protein